MIKLLKWRGNNQSNVEKRHLHTEMDSLASCAFFAANSEASLAALAKSENDAPHIVFLFYELETN